MIEIGTLRQMPIRLPLASAIRHAIAEKAAAMLTEDAA